MTCSKALPLSRAFIKRSDDVLTSVKVMKSYFKVSATNVMEIDAVMWPEYFIISMGANIFSDSRAYERGFSRYIDPGPGESLPDSNER